MLSNKPIYIQPDSKRKLPEAEFVWVEWRNGGP